ncbi:GPI anchor biosynthesis pro [Nucleospora cyclopteri]
MKKYNIALVSDMFYPGYGGVETHILVLGQNFIKNGHKVIVITHRYGEYVGIKKIGDLVVYYLDIPLLYKNVTWPSLWAGFDLYRTIFENHNIEIVNGHQSMSVMCVEALYCAKWMEIKTVLTDHSLFEVGKIERIIINASIRYLCHFVDKVICVSETAKRNTKGRLKFEESRFAVIPNGVNNKIFYPNPEKRKSKFINLLVISRLEFRKGIDLLVKALPIICKNKKIKVTIVGGGFMKDEVLSCIDQNDLQNQIKLLNEIPIHQIGDIMRQNDILLNTSLTESFCTVVIEAFACGLSIVTTNVGGISEIRGLNNIHYCEPNSEDIAAQIFKACANLGKTGKTELLNDYLWENIARETLKVYDGIETKKIDVELSYYSAFPSFKNTMYRIYTFLQSQAVWLSNWFKTSKNE